MNQQTYEIGPEIRELYGERQPDSDFDGLYHHLGFDWSSIFEADVNSFIEKLRGLYTVIGPVAVKNIVVQLLWRVPEGREVEATFLRAVFGEKGVNRQKE